MTSEEKAYIANIAIANIAIANITILTFLLERNVKSNNFLGSGSVVAHLVFGFASEINGVTFLNYFFATSQRFSKNALNDCTISGFLIDKQDASSP